MPLRECLYAHRKGVPEPPTWVAWQEAKLGRKETYDGVGLIKKASIEADDVSISSGSRLPIPMAILRTILNGLSLPVFREYAPRLFVAHLCAN